MGLRGSIGTYMLAHEDIAAAVGTNVFREGEVPQGTGLDYITYRIVRDAPEYHHGGESDMADVEVEIHCWASDTDRLETMENAIRAAFAGTTITVGDVTDATCHLDPSFDGSINRDDASDRTDFRTIFPLTIWFPRSQAA